MLRTSRLGAAVLVLLSCVALASPAAARERDSAPPEFVALRDVDPTIRYDIRYFGRHNFVGERIDGYRVTYEYNGCEYDTRLPYDPGQKIRVRVAVAPAE